ncbi:MAG: hypothetical protein CVV27_07920 [Candidatus Melainabacteria bacterium HGW-Melainabacteria-1]|nr:MAG: hypothetical protein CVV27_07920 [Candidatus Melainabacteria bacterium HGW-Melainabacteria-1]
MNQELNLKSNTPKVATLTWIEDVETCLNPGSLISSDHRLSLPLEGLEISSKVLESVCDTQMVQRFGNPYAEPIEAVYIFPLPGAAAVYAFELRVGDRLVSGEIQERGQARIEPP